MDYSIDELDKGFPKRTDYIYREIEKFESYELTHCLVYEMAIRNDEVKNILHKIEYLSSLRCNILNHPYVSMLTNSITNKEKLEYSKFGIYQLNELIGELEEDLRDKYLIYPYGYNNRTTSYDNYLLSKGILNGMTKESKYSYKSEQLKYDGFTASKGIYSSDDTYDISYIDENFKRKIYDTNKTNITLNISLSETEVVSYIKHIKKTLKINDKKLKSPNELVGKDVKEAQKVANYPKVPTSFKLADMFFVYDYVTAKFNHYSSTKQDILINEIFDEVELLIPKAYYLEKSKNQFLNMEDSRDSILNDLLTAKYIRLIKVAQRRYNKSTIHIKIDDLCDDFSAILSSAQIEDLQKKYSNKIEDPKKNKIFEDIEKMLYKAYIDELNEKYAFIESSVRKKRFREMKLLLNKYKMNSSTASKYYYAIKPYIKECRYPEFLTGISVVKTSEKTEEATTK